MQLLQYVGVGNVLKLKRCKFAFPYWRIVYGSKVNGLHYFLFSLESIQVFFRFEIDENFFKLFDCKKVFN